VWAVRVVELRFSSGRGVEVLRWPLRLLWTKCGEVKVNKRVDVELSLLGNVSSERYSRTFRSRLLFLSVH
jgi:hypothetical protein